MGPCEATPALEAWKRQPAIVSAGPCRQPWHTPQRDSIESKRGARLGQNYSNSFALSFDTDND